MFKHKNKMRRTNFAHVPIQKDTKEQLDRLKARLEEFYPNVTYEELMSVFLAKNEKIVLSSNEVKKIISQKRGVIA